MGPTLTTLSLPALPIGDVGTWRDIVTPPLTEPQIETLAEIRAGMFRSYGMPHPQEVRRREVSLELAVEPGDRARRALDLALTYDAALRKEDALQALDTCLRTLAQAPDGYRDEWESPALSVVRSRLAVHERLVLGWAAGLSRRHPGVRLTASIERELAAYRSRLDEVERRFLFR
jgi:hypothetical protein